MPGENQQLDRSDLLSLTTEIVSGYVANNTLTYDAVSDLIQSVFTKLTDLSEDVEGLAVELVPAVPIKKSITDDYLVCLEDGKKLKMLKRHLMTSYGMTPGDYRAKWGLKADYPMVAPNYALKRRDLAVKIGLGRKRVEEAPAPVAKRPAKSKTKAA